MGKESRGGALNSMEAVAQESSDSLSSRVRLHEAAFVLLGIAALLALLISDKSHAELSAEVGVVVAAYAGVILALSRRSGIAVERTRLLVTYCFTFWFYAATSRISPALGTPTFDAALLSSDRLLFGNTPGVYLDEHARPWLTDILSFCYSSYLVYLHIVVVWAFWQPARVIQRFGASMFSAFALGFLSYLLLPALGPGAAYPSLYAADLHGSFLTWLNDAIVSRGAAIYGTFPSLHLLMTLLLLDNDWRVCRLRFWLMLGPAIGLVISTLYLRYHYATDLLAGAALFIILHYANRRWNR